MAYTGIDKEIYDSGTHFRPLQEYTQQQWTPPEIMGQNTNAGITNTQAAGSYMGYPSYEAWLLAQGGGGGNGGGNEIEEDTFSMGMSPGAMGGKLPGFGNWAKRTLGGLGHAYSKLPTPGNLIMKGIRKWKENRDTKRAEEQRIKEIEVSQRSQANAIAAGGGQPQSGITANTTPAQAAGMGGGSRQATSAGSTNSGRTDGGWGWAQGGRIGMAKGKIPLPRAKTKMGFLDKLFSGIGGLSALIKHPNLRRSIQRTTPSGQRAAAAMLRKYGKFGRVRHGSS